MSTEAVQKIIGRALAEPSYRELLFNKPDEAFVGLELTAEEMSALKGLKRDEFDAAASDLEQRISKSLAGIPVDFHARSLDSRWIKLE